MHYHDAIVRSLTEALWKTVHEYDGTMTVASAIGCLEMVKTKLIQQHRHGGQDLAYPEKKNEQHKAG
jgi:hypothetical protein